MNPPVPAVSSPVLALLAAAVGYLCGSISFARLVGRFVAPGEDLGKTEMQIPGTDEKLVLHSVSATSLSMRKGPKTGCLTSVLDMLKVAIPTLLFKIWYPGTPYFLILALAGVIGHNWPVYYNFKGGRGMSPIFGGMLVIDWLGLIVTNLIGMSLGLLVAKDLFVAYTAGNALLIPWLWFNTHQWTYVAYAVGVNLAFWLADIPELKQYIHYRRLGYRADLRTTRQMTDMGKGLEKIAARLGLGGKKN